MKALRSCAVTGSYVIGILAPFVTVGVFAQQVGIPPGKGAAAFSIALWIFTPFAVGIATAWLARRSVVASLAILGSIVAAAGIQFASLYRAFFRAPAEGGMEVLYGAIEAAAFMAVVTLAMAMIWIGCRLIRTPNKSPEATPGQRPPTTPRPSSGAPHL